MTARRWCPWPAIPRVSFVWVLLAALLLVAHGAGTMAQPSGAASAAPLAAAAPKATAPAAKPPTPPASESGPAWTGLTPAQQAQLGPLRSEWATIDARSKQKWVELAGRMPAMSADERARVQQRMSEWSRLSAAERGQARLQFQQAQRVPADNRQERWQEYQQLPAEQRQALAAKAGQRAQPVQPEPRAATRAQSTSNGQAPGGAADPTVKRNVVRLPSATATPKAVGPSVVQARPGATTSLVTTRPTPPAHHQTGLPKIAATADFVDPSTLLPRRGPQGAAAAPPPARPAPPPARPAPAPVAADTAASVPPVAPVPSGAASNP